MIKRENEIEDFYGFFPQSIREIIDYISSIVFQTYPNVKEKILPNYKGLKYTEASKGVMLISQPTQDEVELKFKNKKTLVIKFFDEIKPEDIEKYLKD